MMMPITAQFSPGIPVLYIDSYYRVIVPPMIIVYMVESCEMHVRTTKENNFYFIDFLRTSVFACYVNRTKRLWHETNLNELKLSYAVRPVMM